MAHDPIPRIGQGTWSVTDPAECVEMISTGLEIGYRHVDTARAYENEHLVGRALARSGVPREDVIVATKIDHQNLAYDDVIEAAEESRERLGVDVIDLLYVHTPRETYDPEDTLPAFDALVDDGVIEHVGVCNFSIELLEEAIDVLDHELFAHQAETHPLMQQPDLVAFAAERGFHHVAHTPLARGNVFEVDVLQEIASKYDTTPATVTLSWLLERGVTAIPRSTDPGHLAENYEATALELQEADLDRITALQDVRQERVNYLPSRA